MTQRAIIAKIPGQAAMLLALLLSLFAANAHHQGSGSEQIGRAPSAAHALYSLLHVPDFKLAEPRQGVAEGRRSDGDAGTGGGLAPSITGASVETHSGAGSLPAAWDSLPVESRGLRGSAWPRAPPAA